MRVLHYQTMMQDPDKAAEFQKRMQEIIKQDELTDWAATLTEEEISGFLLLLQTEKEGRYKVKAFR